ncbi:Copper chaperone CopZ, partial [Haemophilus influenzae]
ILVG